MFDQNNIYFSPLLHHKKLKWHSVTLSSYIFFFYKRLVNRQQIRAVLGILQLQ